MATIHYDSESVGETLPAYILKEDQSPYFDRPRTSATNAGTKMESDNKTSSNLLEYQTRELQRYREAMRKLGQDVLGLRQQVRELETENARLRREVNHSTDGGLYRAVDTMALDDLTKGELATRYANLKIRHDRQTEEMREYRDRVQKLQNELLRKNDVDISSMVMAGGGWSTTSHELRRQLDEEVQRSQTLEATRSRQAIVIAELEKEIANLRVARLDGSALLTEENNKLRRDVTRLQDELERRPAVRDLTIEWANRLEASEARVRALEQQLSNEAHQWNLERADLLAELRDANNRWVPVYPPRSLPPPLPPLTRKQPDDTKPPWRPHHGNDTVRESKEKRLYKNK